jgi:hypothetical protein
MSRTRIEIAVAQETVAFLEGFGRQPTDLYVGHEQYAAIRMDAAHLYKSTLKAETFKGLRVHRVMDKSHLKVTA